MNVVQILTTYVRISDAFCIYFHVYCDNKRGLEWMNTFTDLSQVITTNYCNSLIGLHTLKITVKTTHKIKYSISASTSHCKVTVVKNGYSFTMFTLSVSLAVTLQISLYYKRNSVALVRKRIIPTKRPPHVDEVSANFCRLRTSRGQRNGSPRSYSLFSRQDPLLFLPSSSSIVLTRLSGPRSRPTTLQKI
jgi:hypothetical protein